MNRLATIRVRPAESTLFANAAAEEQRLINELRRPSDESIRQGVRYGVWPILALHLNPWNTRLLVEVTKGDIPYNGIKIVDHLCFLRASRIWARGLFNRSYSLGLRLIARGSSRLGRWGFTIRSGRRPPGLA